MFSSPHFSRRRLWFSIISASMPFVPAHTGARAVFVSNRLVRGIRPCAHGRTFFIALGVLSIVLGVVLWVWAVLFGKILRRVEEGKLVTTGVYAAVRHPVYSAFFLLFTGILLTRANVTLLVVPIVLWIFLTVLMKHTEEKWLLERFGEAYARYAARTNRVFPWFPRKGGTI